MSVPHRQAIHRIAQAVNHPYPKTVTQRELVAHIDSLPDDAWIDKESIKRQLNSYMDGACRLF